MVARSEVVAVDGKSPRENVWRAKLLGLVPQARKIWLQGQKIIVFVWESGFMIM